MPDTQPTDTPDPRAQRIARLRYRAWRRGMREADLIAGPFADQRLDGLDDAGLDAFERLMDVPDNDLYAWMIGQADPAPEHQGPVMDAIQGFARSLVQQTPGRGA